MTRDVFCGFPSRRAVRPSGVAPAGKAAGREAKLCYMGHVTMENRNGLVVAGRVTQANGTGERRASEAMLKVQCEAGRTPAGG